VPDDYLKRGCGAPWRLGRVEKSLRKDREDRDWGGVRKQLWGGRYNQRGSRTALRGGRSAKKKSGHQQGCGALVTGVVKSPQPVFFYETGGGTTGGEQQGASPSSDKGGKQVTEKGGMAERATSFHAKTNKTKEHHHGNGTTKNTPTFPTKGRRRAHCCILSGNENDHENAPGLI